MQRKQKIFKLKLKESVILGKKLLHKNHTVYLKRDGDEFICKTKAFTGFDTCLSPEQVKALITYSTPATSTITLIGNIAVLFTIIGCVIWLIFNL